jgi:hypothetical protein
MSATTTTTTTNKPFNLRSTILSTFINPYYYNYEKRIHIIIILTLLLLIILIGLTLIDNLYGIKQQQQLQQQGIISQSNYYATNKNKDCPTMDEIKSLQPPPIQQNNNNNQDDSSEQLLKATLITSLFGFTKEESVYTKHLLQTGTKQLVTTVGEINRPFSLFILQDNIWSISGRLSTEDIPFQHGTHERDTHVAYHQSNTTLLILRNPLDAIIAGFDKLHSEEDGYTTEHNLLSDEFKEFAITEANRYVHEMSRFTVARIWRYGTTVDKIYVDIHNHLIALIWYADLFGERYTLRYALIQIFSFLAIANPEFFSNSKLNPEKAADCVLSTIYTNDYDNKLILKPNLSLNGLLRNRKNPYTTIKWYDGQANRTVFLSDVICKLIEKYWKHDRWGICKEWAEGKMNR